MYETSEEIKTLTYDDRTQKFLELMKNEYRGRTAKFIRNGNVYYALFEDADVRKNIYGDKRSSPKGWKAKINVGTEGEIFELVENAKLQKETTHGQKFKKTSVEAAASLLMKKFGLTHGRTELAEQLEGFYEFIAGTEQLTWDDIDAEAMGIVEWVNASQTAVATIGTTAVLTEVNWGVVAGSAGLARIASMLTSLAGLPEE